MDIFVPKPMVSIFEASFKSLHEFVKISDYGDYKGEGLLVSETVYDPRFFEEFLQNKFSVQKMKDRQMAYSVGCDVANNLDKWKEYVEKFPAVIRRSNTFKHIDEFLHKALVDSSNDSEFSEALGLAKARMDSLERRISVSEDITLAICGDSKYLGNRKWQNKFESMLPKNVKFCYCYWHSDFMLPNTEGYKWISNLSLHKKNTYCYDKRLWLLKSENMVDGVIFVHAKESALVHVKQSEVLFCKGNLKDENFKFKLEDFYDDLKRKV